MLLNSRNLPQENTLIYEIMHRDDKTLTFELKIEQFKEILAFTLRTVIVKENFLLVEKR